MENSSDETLIETKGDLSDFPWLAKAFEQSKISFDHGKLAHGMLLVAPNQSGKALLANRLAKALLCQRTKEKLTHACGECKSCLLFDAHSHPDFSSLDCLVDSKGKQKKSIGIDQIRQLTSKLSETPQFDGWRVAVILSLEKMTIAAFNAILKTLEEPGDRTLLLLLANSQQQVPATVLSRCQLVTLKLASQDLMPWLMETTKCQQDVAEEALDSCHFAPFAAKDYIQNSTGDEIKSLYQSLDEVFQNKLSAMAFVEKYAYFDNQLWIYIANYFQKVQISILESKQGLYTSVPKTLASDIYAQLLEYNRGQRAGSNLQLKLQLESILIQWFEIGRKIVHYSNR